MLKITGFPVAVHASGILKVLTGARAGKLLERFRLPSYEWLGGWIQGLRDRVWLADLWRSVFKEPMPPDLSVFDAEIAFVQRVDAELFPVDLYAMDGMLGMEETPLAYAIPVYTYGVPWEIGGFGEVDYRDRPMVAVAYAAGLCGEAEMQQELATMYEGHGEALDDEVRGWWGDQGYEEMPALTWPRDRARAVELLRGLPAPMDGLAALYLCVVKQTGCVFYDWPGGGYQYEYAGWDVLWWDPVCIKEITEQFAGVWEEIGRLTAYYQWYNNATRRGEVLETLMSLEERVTG